VTTTTTTTTIITGIGMEAGVESLLFSSSGAIFMAGISTVPLLSIFSYYLEMTPDLVMWMLYSESMTTP